MMRLSLLTLSLFLFVPLAESEEYKEFTPVGGLINWTKGAVVAEGRGAAPGDSNARVAGLLACRAAVVDAQRNLLESTRGVRVRATTLVQQFMLKSDEVRTSVEGEIRGASLLSRELDDQGICTVRMQMFLEGSISNRLYTALYTPGAEYDDDVVWRGLPGAGLVAMSAAFSRSPWSPVRRAQAQSDGAWVEAYELLSERVTALERRLDTTANAVEPAVAASRPTGLVVDARGSNFIPSLSPNIRRLRGAIVYPNPAAQKSLMGSGRLVALFARDVDFALAHPRVGERPLLVKGLRTWGDTRSEIVLGQEAAETVAELATSSFFDDAGVIIVLD